jgi:hypothetical protein
MYVMNVPAVSPQAMWSRQERFGRTDKESCHRGAKMGQARIDHSEGMDGE